MPKSVRRIVMILAKAAVTAGVFYLLLHHEISGPGGTRTPIWRLLGDELERVTVSVLVPFLFVAALLKFLGILASMVRWHLLLMGQGIRFNFGHIVGSFLIGRFLGTFLPSTIGLDGYKLYDAAKFSGRIAEPAAATVVEKIVGLTGVLLTFLLTLPLGYRVLGNHASLVVAVAVPVALLAIALVLLLLLRPALVSGPLMRLGALGGERVTSMLGRIAKAGSVYQGRGRFVAGVMALSFVVHFLTAAMYYFTMFAVGASGASFGEVTFASSIQIFATVMSPFTIAGEGVREVVQAVLLAERIGVGASVLSGALGFWAAEALTLVGGVFLWTRSADYCPKRCEVKCAS